MTRALSESGDVFTAAAVARAVVEGVEGRVFLIPIGLDGWLLRATQPGMSPVTSASEAVLGVLLGPLARLVGIGYLLHWDRLVRRTLRAAAAAAARAHTRAAVAGETRAQAKSVARKSATQRRAKSAAV